MTDLLDPPPSQRVATRVRTPRQVVRALITQLRLQPTHGRREFGWTVEVTGMTDADLAEVVAMLAKRRLRAEYVRELGWFAHFTLRW